MRNAVIEALYQEAVKDPRICFFTGDFQHVRERDFIAMGQRYQNAGMAEQNIIGLAAGAALSGKKVFVYSIIPFITLRCLEQIKMDVCVHNVDVTIIGGGAGFTYGTCGPSHLAIEDIAVMRALPNMKIVCPSGPREAVQLLSQVIKASGPTYLRLNKRGEKDLHDHLPIMGHGVVIRPGSDITIIATGTIVAEALEAATILSASGISTEVVNMHTIKPIDKNLILKRVYTKRLICTLEEHSVIGGLGSAVSEIIAGKNIRAGFMSFGVKDKWPDFVGDQKYLRKGTGLNGESIASAIKESYV